MNEFLEGVKELVTKAYFYIPAILSSIFAIGVPAILKISKILAETTAQIGRARTLKAGFNAVVKSANSTNKVVGELINDRIADIADEIEFLQIQKALTLNAQLQTAIQERIDKLNKKIQELRLMTVGEVIDEISDIDLKLPARKVKVKVVKDDSANK